MKEKIKIITDGDLMQVWIDGKKVQATDVHIDAMARIGQKNKISADITWNKTNENGELVLDDDKIGLKTEGLRIERGVVL